MYPARTTVTFPTGRVRADVRASRVCVLCRNKLTLFEEALVETRIVGATMDRPPQSKELLMRYAMLVYETEAGVKARSDPEYQAAYKAYIKAIYDSGVAVGGSGLQDAATTATRCSRRSTP